MAGAELTYNVTEAAAALGISRRAIGNNINQVARSVNAGIAKAEDAKRGCICWTRSMS